MLSYNRTLTWLAIRRIVSNTLGARTLLHTSTRSATASNGSKKPAAPANSSMDAYIKTVHRIITIVKRDRKMELTLNKLRLSIAIVNSDLVYRILRGCHTHGCESLRFFNWAQSYHTYYEPTSMEVEELVKTLARTKNYIRMWKLFDLMRFNFGLTVSTDAICSIIEDFGSRGLTDQALKIFNQVPKMFNLSPTVEVYNSLLFTLGEARLFDGAYALVRRMIRANVFPNKTTYSVIVSAWCAAGNMKQAQSFLDEMSKKGFNPPVTHRNLLIEGLLTTGHVESAKEMTRKMVKEGISPDVSTFNSLLEAISKSGKDEFCIDIYHEVCRVGMCPNINTYKLLIPNASMLGRIDEAFRLLHGFIKSRHKLLPSLYAPIIEGMCRAGKFDDALYFFRDMKVRGNPPDEPVYIMLITMFGRGGRFVDAGNYLIEMTEKGLAPMSWRYRFVTDGLRKCGNHELAERIEGLAFGQYRDVSGYHYL